MCIMGVVSNNNNMDKTKLVLPISILLGCVILGGFFYASQVIKQESIEKQQMIDLRAKMAAEYKAEQAKTEVDQMKAEAALNEELFNDNLKCQTLLKDLKQRWKNVVGIYYDEFKNTCIVKYTEKGETHESPIEDMQNV